MWYCYFFGFLFNWPIFPTDYPTLDARARFFYKPYALPDVT